MPIELDTTKDERQTLVDKIHNQVCDGKKTQFTIRNIIEYSVLECEKFYEEKYRGKEGKRNRTQYSGNSKLLARKQRIVRFAKAGSHTSTNPAVVTNGSNSKKTGISCSISERKNFALS
ncbi:MAG: hypothetical protein WC269_06485 [Candidatus Gracilibacteria bacterium]